MFEQLEARRLLSAVITFADGVTASQSGSGALIITMDASKATKGGSSKAIQGGSSKAIQGGSSKAIQGGSSKAIQGGSSKGIQGGSVNAAMNITVIENDITQTANGPTIGLGNVLVQDNTTGQEMIFYNVSASKMVQIQGGKGNDTIFFEGTTLGADIQSGDGNDNVTVLDKGSGSSKIEAGNGNDVIAVVYGKNTQIKAGSGSDLILLNTAAATGSPYDYSQSHFKVDAGKATTVGIYAGVADIGGPNVQIISV